MGLKVKKIFVLSLLACVAFSSELANQYRIGGIQGIEKKLDYDLGSRAYWKRVIDATDTTCGYIEDKNATSTCTDKNLISKQELTVILADLYAWRYSWLYNDFAGYIKFYDTGFQRFDGMNLEQFKQYKQRIFGKKESKQIIMKNISITPSAENPKTQFEVKFQETYRSPSSTFSGVKTLLIKVDASGMKIIKE
jgi:murein L,D-transpeptidase YafK